MKIIIFLLSITNFFITNKINHGLIYFDNTNTNLIYLTFDDGYPYKNTLKITNILKENGITATFFLEGDFLITHPKMIEKIVREGNTIGCHTLKHNDITAQSNQAFIEDLLKYEQIYYNITKQKLKYFRPPMGFINNDKIKILRNRGYKIIMWDTTYRDYDRKNDLGPDYAFEMITKKTQGGSIILMHTLLDSNVLALDKIIKELKKNYTFASLDKIKSSGELL